jgi:hypothetical protein
VVVVFQDQRRVPHGRQHHVVEAPGQVGADHLALEGVGEGRRHGVGEADAEELSPEPHESLAERVGAVDGQQDGLRRLAMLVDPDLLAVAAQRLAALGFRFARRAQDRGRLGQGFERVGHGIAFELRKQPAARIVRDIGDLPRPRAIAEARRGHCGGDPALREALRIGEGHDGATIARFSAAESVARAGGAVETPLDCEGGRASV